VFLRLFVALISPIQSASFAAASNKAGVPLTAVLLTIRQRCSVHTLARLVASSCFSRLTGSTLKTATSSLSSVDFCTLSAFVVALNLEYCRSTVQAYSCYCNYCRLTVDTYVPLSSSLKLMYLLNYVFLLVPKIKCSTAIKICALTTQKSVNQSIKKYLTCAQKLTSSQLSRPLHKFR